MLTNSSYRRFAFFGVFFAAGFFEDFFAAFFTDFFASVDSAVARPSTATGSKYNQVSNEFWNAVFDVLSGKGKAKDTLAALDNKLNRMSRGGKW